MNRIFHYFTKTDKRDNLPSLRNDVHTVYDPYELPHMVQMVLMTGIATNPVTAEKIIRKNDITTTDELIAYVQAQRRRPDFVKRFWAMLRNLEGSYENDPFASEWRKRI